MTDDANTDDALVRDVVSAIAADDSKALKRAWRAFGPGVPQHLATKFVMQAFNHDRAKHECTATLLEANHMLATIYKTVVQSVTKECTEATGVDGEGNAGLLLFSTAVRNDDDVLAPLAWHWSSAPFQMVRPANKDEEGDDMGNVRASRDELLGLINNAKAKKCAAWYEAFAWPREAPARSSEACVQPIKITPPAIFGGPRLCMVHEPPEWYERPRTFAHDPRKTVLLVQFGIHHGGKSRRINSYNTTSGGRVETLKRRQDAVNLLDKAGFLLLETCNMRAAFYDAGQDASDFVGAVKRAAAACGLKVAFAARVIDPGVGLLLYHVTEPIVLT